MSAVIDYSTYHFSKFEIAEILIKYNLLFLLIAKLFYNCLWIFLVGNAALPFLLKREEKKKSKDRRNEIRQSFREFILSFGNSLRAGYSIENAFISAYQDMGYLLEPDDDYMKECKWIIGQMQNNQNLEVLFEGFAMRSGVKDIQEFAHVFKVAKKSGGNLSEIIQNTAQIICDKIAVKEEIALLIAAKKMEQTVMNIVPFAIMIYISVTSAGYFDPLYHNVAGVVIMTGCLSVYVLSFLISEKIMALEVDE